MNSVETVGEGVPVTATGAVGAGVAALVAYGDAEEMGTAVGGGGLLCDAAIGDGDLDPVTPTSCNAGVAVGVAVGS